MVLFPELALAELKSLPGLHTAIVIWTRFLGDAQLIIAANAHTLDIFVAASAICLCHGRSWDQADGRIVLDEWLLGLSCV